VDDQTLTDLLREAAQFGNCKDCVYLQAGYPLLCSGCAARTLEPLAATEARCPVCDHPYKTPGGDCLNGPCNMGAANRGFTWNWSIAMRTGVLRQRIDDYKFHDRKGWGLIFGRILVGFLETHRDTFGSMDLLIPSPTYLGQGADRAWDHIGRIVEMAAQEQTPPGWPFVMDPPVIVKTGETPSMAHLARYQERKANAEGPVRDALHVPEANRVRDMSVVVIDDVFTDGLTLREVARALRAAGANAVYGVALARQRYQGG
jgi:predicted amidophosphoribosyltransferase